MGRYGGSTYKLRRNHSKRAEVPNRQQVLSADGAINIADHNIPDTVLITKGTAASITLAAPTAGDPGKGGHDGKQIRIVALTAAVAHTVTVTAGFNGGGTASDVATFDGVTGVIGDHLIIEAYNGTWYVVGNQNVTLG